MGTGSPGGMLNFTFHITINLIYVVNCGPPFPPPSGFILPYVSTIDGAEVRFTCQKSALNLNQEENITMTVCNKQGIWDP